MRSRTALRVLGWSVLIGTAALLGYALWWRKNPSACPYSQRFWVELPHPFITRKRLREALEPRPGERILEVGPGTGYYAVSAVEWLSESTPQGTLDVIDLQQEMLDHVARRVRERDLNNIILTRGDATALPYTDASFEAAYLAVVLGETPDQDVALRELRRVLKPGGRLVVGEIFGDPHYVAFSTLQRRAREAGLSFERRIGGPLGYFARFTVPGRPIAHAAEKGKS